MHFAVLEVPEPIQETRDAQRQSLGSWLGSKGQRSQDAFQLERGSPCPEPPPLRDWPRCHVGAHAAQRTSGSGYRCGLLGRFPGRERAASLGTVPPFGGLVVAGRRVTGRARHALVLVELPRAKVPARIAAAHECISPLGLLGLGRGAHRSPSFRPFSVCLIRSASSLRAARSSTRRASARAAGDGESVDRGVTVGGLMPWSRFRASPTRGAERPHRSSRRWLALAPGVHRQQGHGCRFQPRRYRVPFRALSLRD